ncbi:MAG: abortive infection family protein [Methyloglobulus sp.]|nr:abortive infection family protein [Methyloglobulus sp.]
MCIAKIDNNTKLKGQLMIALQKAIVATFDNGNWHEIGYLTNSYDYITGHSRLLRSLHWNDPDYDGCVHQILDAITQDNNEALLAILEYKTIKSYLQKNSPELYIELGLGDAHVSSVPPIILATDVVRKALTDADSLLLSNGAVSAIDRLHTALHGYLRSVCSEAQIQVPNNAAVTVLFKALRTEHIAFQQQGHQQNEINRILTSFASIVDSLNTIRNHGSIAHPNETLLENDEAELTVNAVRTLFNYLVKKVG